MNPMSILTLYAVAFMGSLLIVAVKKPVQALAIFAGLLLLFPQHLMAPVGGADFNISRLCILALWARILFRDHAMRRLKFNIVDFWVLVLYLGQMIALTRTVPPSIFLMRHAGAFFDTVMIYFAFRALLRTREDLYALTKGLVMVAMPLGIMGIMQAVTHRNPVDVYTFQPSIVDPRLFRHGLYRADASFGNYIGFGMYFAAMAPLAFGLLARRTWSWFKVGLALSCIGIGLISAMSSGPLFTVFAALGTVVLYHYRSFWRPALVVLVFLCLVVEFISNRHFYYIPTRFAFNSETAYYRIGLYEEAFGGGMSGHWLFGYGYVGVGPGNDNTNFFWQHMDFTSIYIHQLAWYGLMAFIPFCCMTWCYFRRLYAASSLVRKTEDMWMLWCWSACLIGWAIGMLAVAPVAQMRDLYYLFIAVAVNMPLVLAGAPQPAQTRSNRRRRTIRRAPNLAGERGRKLREQWRKQQEAQIES